MFFIKLLLHIVTESETDLDVSFPWFTILIFIITETIRERMAKEGKTIESELSFLAKFKTMIKLLPLGFARWC